MMLFYRCKAVDTDLDKPAGWRSHEETRQLREVIDSNQLWDEFGIDDDITVCIYCSLSWSISHKIKALHDQIPARRHSRDAVSGHTPSTGQRHFQGPPGPMDMRLPACNTRRDSRQRYLGRYRPQVSEQWNIAFNTNKTKELLPLHHSLPFVASPKEGASSNGPGTIPKH